MDQISLRGVYTQESNEEAEKNIYSTKNILSITSDNVRKITNEGIQTLYNLTKS